MKAHNVLLSLFPTLSHEKFLFAWQAVVSLMVNREADPLVMQMRMEEV
jgi:hypothetical protein